MPWWMWLLLILVLLSLMVLIVLLLLWLRRRKVATSEPMQATAAPADREPPAEPTTMITVEPEPLPEEAVDQAQEVTTEIEEAVQEAVGEAQETTAEAKAAAQEAKDEITETATATGQAADQVVQEIIEPIESRVKQAIRAEPPPDDLKIIEGIGPKISSVFQAAGIATLAQLAATEVDELKRILREANIRLGDPETWPEQAGLAAEGKWDELAALQDSLKGGRRV